MILYKLTDQNMRTHDGFQWTLGKRYAAKGEKDGPLCSSSWMHAYEHPGLAVFLNPLHADFAEPRLFEARGTIGKREGALKVGCRTLTLVRELECPAPTAVQCVAFAIYCAKAIFSVPDWDAWAVAWLSGKDRSAAAAWAAEAAWAAPLSPAPNGATRIASQVAR